MLAQRTKQRRLGRNDYPSTAGIQFKDLSDLSQKESEKQKRKREEWRPDQRLEAGGKMKGMKSIVADPKERQFSTRHSSRWQLLGVHPVAKIRMGVIG